MDDRHKILTEIDMMRKSFGMKSTILCKVFVSETGGTVYEAYEQDARKLSPLVDIPIFNEDGLTLFSFPEIYFPDFLAKLTGTNVMQVYIVEYRQD